MFVTQSGRLEPVALSSRFYCRRNFDHTSIFHIADTEESKWSMLRYGLGYQAISSLSLETISWDEACQLPSDCIVTVGFSRKTFTFASTCYKDV